MRIYSFLLHSKNRIKPNQVPKVYKTAKSQAESLKSKGFLRAQSSYDPPVDVSNRVKEICQELNVSNFRNQKFDVLNKCYTAFSHSVPNSQLCEIKCIDDVIEFYSTSIQCQTPFETLDKDKSVPNMHIISDYKRYNPEEDGVSAFPKSSTLVTGLKYRNKYKGHIAKTSWP